MKGKRQEKREEDHFVSPHSSPNSRGFGGKHHQ